MKLWKMFQSWGFHQFRKFQLSNFGSGPNRDWQYWYIYIYLHALELPPTQDSSHHQDYDYEPFLGSRNPNRNFIVWLASWAESRPNVYIHYLPNEQSPWHVSENGEKKVTQVTWTGFTGPSMIHGTGIAFTKLSFVCLRWISIETPFGESNLRC